MSLSDDLNMASLVSVDDAEIEKSVTKLLIRLMTEAMQLKAAQGNHEYRFYYTDFQATFRDCVKMINKTYLPHLIGNYTYDAVFDKIVDYFAGQGIECDAAYDTKMLAKVKNERRARTPIFRW